MKNWQFWMLWVVLFLIALDISVVAHSLGDIAEVMDPANRMQMYEEILKGLQ